MTRDHLLIWLALGSTPFSHSLCWIYQVIGTCRIANGTCLYWVLVVLCKTWRTWKSWRLANAINWIVWFCSAAAAVHFATSWHQCDCLKCCTCKMRYKYRIRPPASEIHLSKDYHVPRVHSYLDRCLCLPVRHCYLMQSQKNVSCLCILEMPTITDVNELSICIWTACKIRVHVCQILLICYAGNTATFHIWYHLQCSSEKWSFVHLMQHLRYLDLITRWQMCLQAIIMRIWYLHRISSAVTRDAQQILRKVKQCGICNILLARAIKQTYVSKGTTPDEVKQTYVSKGTTPDEVNFWFSLVCQWLRPSYLLKYKEYCLRLQDLFRLRLPIILPNKSI